MSSSDWRQAGWLVNNAADRCNFLSGRDFRSNYLIDVVRGRLCVYRDSRSLSIGETMTFRNDEQFVSIVARKEIDTTPTKLLLDRLRQPSWRSWYDTTCAEFRWYFYKYIYINALEARWRRAAIFDTVVKYLLAPIKQLLFRPGELNWPLVLQYRVAWVAASTRKKRQIAITWNFNSNFNHFELWTLIINL